MRAVGGRQWSCGWKDARIVVARVVPHQKIGVLHVLTGCLEHRLGAQGLLREEEEDKEDKEKDEEGDGKDNPPSR